MDQSTSVKRAQIYQTDENDLIIFGRFWMIIIISTLYISGKIDRLHSKRISFAELTKPKYFQQFIKFSLDFSENKIQCPFRRGKPGES